MAQIKYSNQILNQKGNPAWYEDIFANRPAFGFVGRMFVSTDTGAFYRDNGAGWDLIGGTGTGAVTGTGTATQIAYWNSASGLTSSANLFWDNTNARLGISNNLPGAALDVHSATTVVAQFEDTTLNDSLIAFRTSGTGYWRIGNLYNAGANSFVIYDNIGATNRLTITNTGVTTLTGAFTATSVAISGGTAAQFLKANGTIDSNTYVTSASLASYLPLTGGTLTGGLTGTTAQFTGLTLNGAGSGNFTLNTTNATASTSVITGSIVTAGGIGATGAIWAGSFVKNGGSASQFLKADGSIDNTSYAAAANISGTTNYIARFSSTTAIGIGTIYDDGTNIALGIAAPISIASGTKSITANGTATAGGGLVSSVTGVAKSYYFFDGTYSQVQGSTGIGAALSVNGGTNIIMASAGGTIGFNASPLSDRFIYASGTTTTTGANQYAFVLNPTFGATATNYYGLFAQLNVTGAFAATNGYGIYIPAFGLGGGATITNKYGIYQAGTENNFFGGTIQTSSQIFLKVTNTVNNDILFNASTNHIRVVNAAQTVALFDMDNNGAAVYYNTLQASSIFAQSDSSATSPNQIQVQGNTNTLKQLLIGYNTTGSGYGSLQSIFQGTSVTPLVFQASGGNVLIGSTTDSGQAILQVAGVTNTFGLSTTGEVVSATATLTKQYYHVFTGVAGQTLTMPSPASNNIQYCVINNTSNTVTVAGAATTNIITLTNTSVASITLAANARAIFIADGNNKYYQIV